MTLKPILSKLTVGAAVTGLAVTASAAVASAHEPEIVTPNGNVVTLPCEPFHGETPGQSQHSANWDAVRGLHPIHWGLHKGPGADHRNIEVRVSADVCP
jgi:hypothetical protein